MASIEEQIKKFLSVSLDSADASNYGSGYASYSGNGHGSGDGYGSIDGTGDGDGSGSGYGYFTTDGYGSGNANSNGYGGGEGSGNCYSSGEGSGNGYGIKSYNGQKVYNIDGVQTLIYSVLRNYARGAVLYDDLTIAFCYIAKVGNCFAHGETLKDARRDAEAKWIQKRPVEERIDEFVKAHPELDTLYNDLFTWHNILTGSCEMGRKEWCKNHGHSPDDSISVREFIDGTKNDYGGKIIMQLAKAYNIN